MQNLLRQRPDYLVVETALGRWRRFLYPDGRLFAEFRSHATLFGLPWIHYTRGISPETGGRLTARGVIAVGRVAVGGLALGQVAVGLLAVGQLAVGFGFALGQGCAGVIAVGQLALGGEIAVGQLAAAPAAIGQLAAGEYVIAQKGYGAAVWSQERRDEAALDHFRQLRDALLPAFRREEFVESGR